MSSNHLIMASNKQAAFHVYADLCEGQFIKFTQIISFTLL